MAVLRALCTIPMASALPADAVVNTWYFGVPDGDETETYIETNVEPSLKAFYAAIDEYYANNTATTNATVTWYDMSEPEPRVPIVENNLGMTQKGSSAQGNLPSELAVVMSFHGAYVSGTNRQRQRGRIYVGPLHAGIGAGASGTDYSRPGSAFVTALRNAGNTLMGAASGSGGAFTWIVRSANARDNSDPEIPYNERPLLTPTGYPVVGGWVDDAWDVQRRRGVAASTRNTFGSIS